MERGSFPGRRPVKLQVCEAAWYPGVLGNSILGLERRLRPVPGYDERFGSHPGPLGEDPVLNLEGGARFWYGRELLPGQRPTRSSRAAPACTPGLQGRHLTSLRRLGGRYAACSPCATALPSSPARTRCRCPR